MASRMDAVEKIRLRRIEKKLGLCKHDCGKPKPVNRDEKNSNGEKNSF